MNSKLFKYFIFSFFTMISFSTNAQTVTHLGVHSDQLVTLEWSFISDGNNICETNQFAPGFARRLPNGNVVKNRFVVPRGKRFIITDVIWQARPFDNTRSFKDGSIVLAILTAGQPNGRLTPMFSTPLVHIDSSKTSSFVGDHVNIQAGLAVGSGRAICMHTENRTLTNFVGVSDFAFGQIFGYLVDK